MGSAALWAGLSAGFGQAGKMLNYAWLDELQERRDQRRYKQDFAKLRAQLASSEGIAGNQLAQEKELFDRGQTFTERVHEEVSAPQARALMGLYGAQAEAMRRKATEDSGPTWKDAKIKEVDGKMYAIVGTQSTPILQAETGKQLGTQDRVVLPDGTSISVTAGLKVLLDSGYRPDKAMKELLRRTGHTAEQAKNKTRAADVADASFAVETALEQITPGVLAELGISDPGLNVSQKKDLKIPDSGPGSLDEPISLGNNIDKLFDSRFQNKRVRIFGEEFNNYDTSHSLYRKLFREYRSNMSFPSPLSGR